MYATVKAFAWVAVHILALHLYPTFHRRAAACEKNISCFFVPQPAGNTYFLKTRYTINGINYTKLCFKLFFKRHRGQTCCSFPPH